MKDRFERTIRLIGKDGLAKLQAAKVLIVGVGGVGSYAAEAIARAAVGTVAVMDGDQVAASNLNRQLVALTSTIGRNKAEVMAERIRDINPDCRVEVIPNYYIASEHNLQSNKSKLYENISSGVSTEISNPDISNYDWIIDCIDDVDAKVSLIETATKHGVNIISSMGTAGKFETDFKVADISKTTVCPLAKTMRKRLRDIGIEHLPVVYSEEKATVENGLLGTVSYVPGSAGLKLAEYVIKKILDIN